MSNSDYNKPRTNLYELLPEVLKSDVNKSVFENVFNRYLTKRELEYVEGYVGQGNPNALINRQIVEPTPNRQAYQLQPILHDRVGTVDHMATYVDLMNKLERLGVDLSRQKKWGSAQQFNWVPPINIDKIINYRDYYWFNPDALNSQPQYITIRNLCRDAEARVDGYEQMLAQYGITHSIQAINKTDKTFSIYGDLSDLFIEGFVFSIYNSLNSSINNKQWTTVSSSYSSSTNLTTIEVSQTIGNDAIVNGDISLQDNLAVYESVRDCLCHGSVGWDGAQWDDGQIGDVVWNTTLLEQISHSTESDWLTYNITNSTEWIASGSPQVPEQYALWFDTTTDELKQYIDGAWSVVRTAFSATVALTEGRHLWDFSRGCQTPTNQWVEQNHWIHKYHITNFSVAKQAQIPIIEFDPHVELNEWVEVEHTWKYRKTKFDNFESTDAKPTLFELNDISISDLDDGNKQFIIDSQYGDLTNIFIPGYTFRIVGSTGNDGFYTVDYSLYKESILPGSPVTKGPYQTVIVVNETIPDNTVDGKFVPVTTSVGDPWKALHEHWLYVGTSDNIPTTHQPSNPFIEVDPTSTVLEVENNTTISRYQYEISQFAQNFTVLKTGGLDTFLLDSSLHDISKVSTNDIRVYVNNVRQYGNYVEGIYIENVTSTGSPAQTVLTISGDGSTSSRFNAGEIFDVVNFGSPSETKTLTVASATYNPTTNKTDIRVNEDVVTNVFQGSYIKTPYVIGISFLSPIAKLDAVRVEVGAAAVSDIGWERVSVRTDETESAWIANGTTEYSLVKYRKTEQVKTSLNQYPLFNHFEVNGDVANKADMIFAYQESSSYAINPHIGKRIVEINQGRDYGFEQTLIDRDDTKMYAYRDTSRLNLLDQDDVRYWYNPETETVNIWDGITWRESIIADGHYITPIVSSSEPSSPWKDINGMVWFDTKTQELKVRDTSVPEWTVDANCYIQDVDETMQTIWRGGLNDDQYIPEYVDGDRQPVAIGSSAGDWEIPNQLYYNHSHENKKQINFSELLTHFSSIIESQPRPIGFFGGKEQVFHLIDDVNYGIGGTIKEHNGSYDTFLSSLFINKVTPPALFEFAQDQYEVALINLIESFKQHAVEYLTNTSLDYLVDMNKEIADQVITIYESNESNELLYGDSTSYNSETGDGIRNWIATLPFLGIVDKHKPELLKDEQRDILEVVHHDGHRSHPSILPTIQELIIQQVLATKDTRNFSGDTIGVTSAQTPPDTMPEMLTAYGSTVPLTGLYWYHVNGATRNLYKFNVVSTQQTPPPSTLDDGVMWYRSDTNTLYIKTNSGWVPVTTVGDSVITSAWKKIDLDEIAASIIYEAETRLYNASPDLNELSFDFSSIIDDSADQQAHDTYEQEAFATYISDRNIDYPYSVRLIYNAADPFTWNYKSSSIASYPSSANVGNESGGTWQDLYEKVYGTPYPHLEPWKLQGYTSKPSWWDQKYKQTDGSRRWVYTHNGLTINQVNTSTNTLLINGDWTKLLEVGTKYDVNTTMSPSMTLDATVVSTSYDVTTDTTSVVINETVTSNYISGQIPGPIGMWENIRVGVIPAGELLPSGELSSGSVAATPSYTYFSVNIDDIIVDGKYNPDDIFPPYWDHKSLYGTNSVVRTIFHDLGYVVDSNFNYNFNDAGLEEWKWRSSSQYLYDKLTVAFRMQPVQFLDNTFGVEYYTVAGLNVDKRTGKVYSHRDALFHGDIVNDSDVVSINGLNQWYVNYARSSGFDLSFADFRKLWSGWDAPLGYQFGSFVDTTGVQVINSNFDVNQRDYDIVMKRSPGIDDLWVDSFNVTLTYTPPAQISYNTATDWEFSFDIPSRNGKSITIYGTHNYEFTFDQSGVGTLYQYSNIATNAVNNSFAIENDKTDIFVADKTITVSGSSGNDGTYTIDNVAYDAINNRTVIYVAESITYPISDGQITVSHYQLPWNTGDEVYLSTTGSLPAGINDTTRYYIIRYSNNTFSLASSHSNAIDDTPINITALGTGIHFVGQVKSTFRALEGEEVWRHYEINKNIIHTLTPPFDIKGMQHVVDTVDGYVAYMEDQGFTFADNSITQADSETGRPVSWQLELERFIDWAFRHRRIKYQEPDYYPITANPTDNKLVFVNETPNWGTGTKVTLSNFNGDMPVPLLRNAPYYIIRRSLTEFQLALSETDANNGKAIDITTIGTGDLVVQQYVDRKALPKHEINPFRNNIWINHAQGIVTDVIDGPYKDIRSEQTIYDQYGQPINANEITVLREDNISRIQVNDEILNNNVTMQTDTVNQYTYLHMGGAHIFLDGYEHIILFNDYAVSDALIYDPFLGLNTARFDLQFEQQTEFTLRPNVGGYVLHEKELVKNFETAITEVQNYYDTYGLSETSDVAYHSRQLLGYERQNTYLDSINVNPKSKFVFWRGMIRSKGSVNSIEAFINSKRFIDANVDEYWAYKVAEFGDAREKEYIAIKLFTTDVLVDTFKVEFVDNTVTTTTPGFTTIRIDDKERWYNQPLQKRKLLDNGNVMYFDAEVTTIEDVENNIIKMDI